MWSLHDITEQIKQGAKWIAIGLLGLFIIFLVIKLIGAIHKALTPPPPPSVEYGKLQSILFPPFTPQDSTSYAIDTVSGHLPTYPDRLPVFKMLHDTPTLQNLANARDKIHAIGFSSEFGQTLNETPISESKYQWQDGSGRVLDMNIDTYDFLLSTPYQLGLSPSSPTLASQSYDPNKAISSATDFLSKMGLLPTDLQTDPQSSESAAVPQIELLKMQDGTLTDADTNTAQVVRVDLFQKYVDITDSIVKAANITQLPIYYPQGTKSIIYGYFIPNNGTDPTVGAFSYHHQYISNESSTYPIISSTQAFDELKAGRAYIAVHDPNTSIPIKTVSLGYYLSEDKVDYMQPIYIFKGDATPDGKYQFIAYVPAVAAAYVQEKQ